MDKQARLREILSGMTQEQREAIAENPDLMRVELARRKKDFPCKDFVPNIGQRRFFNKFRAPLEETGDYYHEGIVRCGNGWGKTCSLAVFLAGCTLGVEFMHPTYFNLQFFRDMAKIRRKRGLRIRLIGDAADMEEQGSLYQEIKTWIPCAEFSAKEGKYYSKVKIPAPSPEYHETVVNFKTFAQETVAHAGPNLDIILENEPAPRHLYTENKARLRVGGYTGKSGYYFHFLTPLKMAAHLHKVEQKASEPGELFVVQGSIWDNCADIPGNDGHLSKSKIEELIRDWRAQDPLELPARENGKYMFLAGAVFTLFSREIHVIEPLNIEPNWNIFMAVDPHDAKPPFALWCALSPNNILYVIAEYPTQNWESITSTPLTIKQHGSEFRRIENGRHEKFQYINKLHVMEHFGDPNKMADRQPNTGRTMADEYEAAYGSSFITDINDDIGMRHDAIRDLLLYNPEAQITSLNTPHLFYF